MKNISASLHYIFQIKLCIKICKKPPSWFFISFTLYQHSQLFRTSSFSIIWKKIFVTTTAKIQKINLKIIHTLSILTSHTVCVSQLIGLRGWGIRGCEMQQPMHGFILRWIIHCAVMLLLWFPHPRAVMTEAILYIYKY